MAPHSNHIVGQAKPEFTPFAKSMKIVDDRTHTH